LTDLAAWLRDGRRGKQTAEEGAGAVEVGAERGRGCGVYVCRAGLQAGFEEIKRVSDHYADGAAEVAGPEVGGH